jgi:hypothetical protein
MKFLLACLVLSAAVSSADAGIFRKRQCGQPQAVSVQCQPVQQVAPVTVVPFYAPVVRGCVGGNCGQSSSCGTSGWYLGKLLGR